MKRKKVKKKRKSNQPLNSIPLLHFCPGGVTRSMSNDFRHKGNIFH